MAEKRIYGQFCPVAIGAEVFATKWTPLLFRELLAGSTRFGELLKGVPLMSRSLLAQRLKELEDAGLVTSAPLDNGNGSEYFLTEAGKAVEPMVIGLGEWAQDYLAVKIPDPNLDPGLLMWDVQRNIDADALPPSPRIVVEFELHGTNGMAGRWWLHIEHKQVELCNSYTGFANDLVIRANVRQLTEVWMGQISVSKAIATKKLVLEGDRELRQTFPEWFTLSNFAPRALKKAGA